MTTKIPVGPYMIDFKHLSPGDETPCYRAIVYGPQDEVLGSATNEGTGGATFFRGTGLETKLQTLVDETATRIGLNPDDLGKWERASLVLGYAVYASRLPPGSLSFEGSLRAYARLMQKVNKLEPWLALATTFSTSAGTN